MNFWLAIGAQQLQQLDQQQQEAQRAVRRARLFRDRTNPLDLPDDELFQQYRFPRPVLLDLIEQLRQPLMHPTRRSQSIPVEVQVCVALRFFATGSFFQVLGDVLGISKSSVSISVKQVSELLSGKCNENIRFPMDQASRNRTMQEFHDVAGLPQVLGAIDCTHISIVRPNINENQYVNRKGKHSINVQAVCDANMSFTNIVVRHPGSSHDAFIWENCGLKEYLVDNAEDAFLVGDSGYPLRRYLLKIYDNPVTVQQRRFNNRLKKTRVKIECSFGVLKSRFRCLDSSGGILLFQPDRACKLIVACMVLHNIAIRHRLPIQVEAAAPMDEFGDNEVVDQFQDAIDAGRQRRNEVANGLN